jgi:tetratricopeptide (TPR) repeat protein
MLSAFFIGCTPGLYTKMDSTVPALGPIAVGMSRGMVAKSLGDPVLTMWLDNDYYTSIYEYEIERGVTDILATDIMDVITLGLGVYIVSPIDRYQGTKHLLTLTYAVNDRYRENDSVISVDDSQSLNEVYGRHWAEKSRLSVTSGEWAEGIGAASYAIAFNPGLASPYINRAWAYSEIGMHDQAIGDCNTALSIYSNSASAYNNRGLAYQKKGDLGQAISDYTQACNLGLAKACENLKIASDHKTPESPTP